MVTHVKFNTFSSPQQLTILYIVLKLSNTCEQFDKDKTRLIEREREKEKERENKRVYLQIRRMCFRFQRDEIGDRNLDVSYFDYSYGVDFLHTLSNFS